MKHPILTTLTSGVLASALGACSAGPTRELADARRAYDDAEDSAAADRNPAQLERARVALDRAEEAHDEDPGSAREKRLAERAEYRAKLAMNHADADLARTQRAVSSEEQAAARREEAAMEREDVRAERNARVDDRDDRAMPPARKAESALQNLGQVANVKQEPRGVVITLSGSLLFPSGDEKLSPVARQNLDQVAHALAQQPADTTFQVEGYTDDSGSPKQNEQLAAHRAKAVADHLIASGIDASRIRVVSHGEDDPIANNDTAEGRAANRRVEIVVEQNKG